MIHGACARDNWTMRLFPVYSARAYTPLVGDAERHTHRIIRAIGTAAGSSCRADLHVARYSGRLTGR